MESKELAPQTLHLLEARFKQEKQNLCVQESITGSTITQQSLDCLRGNLHVLSQLGDQQKMLGG